MSGDLREFTPSYILHTRAFGTYLLGGGVFTVHKTIVRWWYFACKKLENIICDGILHVNMFHYFKIPYFTYTFFIKFTYNKYIGPYFLSHIVLRFLPVISPSWWQIEMTCTTRHVTLRLPFRRKCRCMSIDIFFWKHHMTLWIWSWTSNEICQISYIPSKFIHHDYIKQYPLSIHS
jgi:hypothetical protein